LPRGDVRRGPAVGFQFAVDEPDHTIDGIVSHASMGRDVANRFGVVTNLPRLPVAES
jgi:hypothetical protein